MYVDLTFMRFDFFLPIHEQMKGSADSVADCTSGQYDGIVALTQPKGSWVGKWQRIST